MLTIALSRRTTVWIALRAASGRTSWMLAARLPAGGAVAAMMLSDERFCSVRSGVRSVPVKKPATRKEAVAALVTRFVATPPRTIRAPPVSVSVHSVALVVSP